MTEGIGSCTSSRPISRSSNTWPSSVSTASMEPSTYKTEKDKCRKFIDGLNDDLCLTFKAMEIDDFQTLVNQVTTIEYKMKAAICESTIILSYVCK
ncbi:hypothetical protein GQ457_13G018140 [Hibiscus cannabinus]